MVYPEKPYAEDKKLWDKKNLQQVSAGFLFL